MAKSRLTRTIPLFSKEAAAILAHPVLQSGHSDVSIASTTTTEDHLKQEGMKTEYGLNKMSGGRDLFCLSCQVSMADREEQVSHYRLDWHRYNLKRKLKGHPPVRQEDFEKIAGDLSSISGSESDSDPHSEEEERSQPLLTTEDVATDSSKVAGSPYAHFTLTTGGEMYAVYKSVLHGSKWGADANESKDLLKALKEVNKQQTWIVLMRAGGHFAGAVFKGSALVAHKTFHRYTVRAKRGTAQSVRDSQGHAPKSAGATLRRYNEVALVQEIQELIHSWSQHVEEASAIFIRTPKYSRGTFIGDGSKSGGHAPFSKEDPRLRNIPFATRRPTLKEVQNTHSKLAAIYVNIESRVDANYHKSPKSRRKEKSVDTKLNEDKSARNFAKVVMGSSEDLVQDESVLEGEEDDVPEEDVQAEKGGREKSNKKKKKKKGKKITSESIPENIQFLLKLCVSESSEEEMVEHLVSMGLTPLHSAASSTVPQLESSDQHGNAVNNSQQEEEETPPENTCSSTSVSIVDCEVSAAASHSIQAQSEIVSPREELNKLWNGETVLHAAAFNGCTHLIPALLIYGANPSIRNQSGHTPYLVSKDKAVRDSFRRFMATHPTMYDYSTAQIPSPLTEDMERERKEKLAEKKKAQKKAKKQKEKERKTEKELASAAESREKAVAQLSEREKRALAAEKRMAVQVPSSAAVSQAGACVLCSQSLAGVVPFERLQYKYCSMNCLKTHRTQLASN